jgi:putative DNA primase/helicase
MTDKQPQKYPTNKGRISDVYEHVKMKAHLPIENNTPPCWVMRDRCLRKAASEYISCKNGFLHLPTMTIEPATPELFTISGVNVTYDPRAPKPIQWFGFLAEITGGNQEKIDAIQEMMGYLLTAETHHQKAFMMVGPKRSGKGTIARIIQVILGANNVCSPTLSSLSTNFGLQPLIGKQVAIVSDARLGQRSDASVIAERILSISGEDSLTIDRKYKSSWTGKLCARFLILSNEIPRIPDVSGALASRFVIIKLDVSFYGKEDHGLFAKLCGELPGIFLWAVEGYKRLRERGYFATLESSETTLKQFEDLGSPMTAFVNDRCELGESYECEPSAMFDAWQQWCRENGIERVGSIHVFSRDLHAAVPGLEIRQHRILGGERKRFYVGIRLRESKE